MVPSGFQVDTLRTADEDDLIESFRQHLDVLEKRNVVAFGRRVKAHANLLRNARLLEALPDDDLNWDG